MAKVLTDRQGGTLSRELETALRRKARLSNVAALHFLALVPLEAIALSVVMYGVQTWLPISGYALIWLMIAISLNILCLQTWYAVREKMAMLETVEFPAFSALLHALMVKRGARFGQVARQNVEVALARLLSSADAAQIESLSNGDRRLLQKYLREFRWVAEPSPAAVAFVLAVLEASAAFDADEWYGQVNDLRWARCLAVRDTVERIAAGLRDRLRPDVQRHFLLRAASRGDDHLLKAADVVGERPGYVAEDEATVENRVGRADD